MLPDDLFGLEALDPLGAAIPARHETVRVEHVDRIVDDRLNQQLERALGPPLLHLLRNPRQSQTPRPRGGHINAPADNCRIAIRLQTMRAATRANASISDR